MTKYIRPYLIVTITIFSLLFITDLYAQADKRSELDQYFKTYSAAGKLSGHVLVEVDGKIIFEESYGAATQRFDVANNKATVYKLGKLTQPLISWLVMKAYADGVVDIDKPITTYIAEYPNEIGQKVKLIHLLGHTSGLPDFTTNEKYFEKNTCGEFTTEQFITEFCSGKPAFTAGSKSSFSYTNYYLLGLILERAYKKDLGTIIKNTFSETIGMKSTGLIDPASIVKGLSDGYTMVDGVLKAPVYINIDFVGGAAGMYSSAVDLIKFMDHLSTDDVASKKQNSIVENLGGNNMLGWEVSEVYGHRRKSSSSVFNGYATLMDIYPDDNVKVIFLSNYEFAPIGRIAADVPAILFDKPYVAVGDLKEKSSSAAALMKYTGNYVLTNEAGDFPMSVVVEDDVLKVGDKSNGFSKLIFAGDDHFFFEGPDHTIVRFNMLEDKVTGFSIITDSKFVTALKK